MSQIQRLRCLGASASIASSGRPIQHPSIATTLRQPQISSIRSSRCLYSTTSRLQDEKVAPGGMRKGFQPQMLASAHERKQREEEQRRRFGQMNDEKPASLLYKVTMSVIGGLGLFAAGYYFARLHSPLPPLETSTSPLSDSIPPQHDIRPTNMQAAWGDIRDIIGKENVITTPDELSTHSGSSWSSHPALEGDVPFMIVKPGSTEDMSRIMKVCWEKKIPVTAYSGGTSLEGHFAATRGGICVDFSRMDQILTLHKDDLDVVVQPAVGWEALNIELAKDGLFFPPDPGPGAMIGGMVGTGCSGTNAYRYGTMRDWVISLTVVLADGTIVKTRQRPRKSSAGYDLTKIFIGSEGTLGLVTEAVLKVTPTPQTTSVAVSSFKSIRAAADAVFKVVNAGVPIAAIEILDDEQMRCINLAGSTSRDWKEAPTLFFKFAGTPSSVKEHIAQVKKIAQAEGSQSFEFAKSKDEAAELWEARKEALWSVMGLKKHDGERVWTTDVAVPISRLADIIDETKDDIKKSGLTGTIVGHVGDGNFHAIILYDPDPAKNERKTVEGVVHRMVKRAIEMEGTSTGEHGVGLVKRDYLEHEVGKSTVDLMRRLKNAWDPRCLLNCDKVVRVQQPGPGDVHEW